MSAFAVFFTQSPSFLVYQRALKLRQGRCNLESLFGVREVPSDNQIRNVLDNVPWGVINEVYGEVFVRAEASGLLESRRSHGGHLLLAIERIHFIFTCKPGSHPYLDQTFNFLEANKVVEHLEQRYWNGKHGELWRYRFVNEVSLTAEAEKMQVNWFELTILHETTGEILYRNV